MSTPQKDQSQTQWTVGGRPDKKKKGKKTSKTVQGGVQVTTQKKNDLRSQMKGGKIMSKKQLLAQAKR